MKTKRIKPETSNLPPNTERIKFNTEPLDNWIPASKKPIENGEYIVTSKAFSNSVSGTFYNGEWYIFGNRVTHWMPFPKPPKQIKTKKGKA